MLQEAGRQVLVVDWDRDPKFGPGGMEQPSVAARVVMNVKTGTLKCRENLFGLENRELGWRPKRRLRKSDRNSLGGKGVDVAGD